MIHQSFAEIFRKAPRQNGLRYGEQFLAYDEVLMRTKGVAAGLQAKGIGAGDPVALLLPNSPELFVVAHALFALGAIAMPLSMNATRAEIEMALKKSRAVAIVTAESTAEMAEISSAFLRGGSGGQVFVAGNGTANSLDELASTPPIDLSVVNGERPALYLLSSGSTGMPKIVVHTQSELMADAIRTRAAWKLSAEDVVFDMLPGNFAMGLLLGIMDAASVGATVVYWHDTQPLLLARRALLETLEAEKVTVMGAVPAMYETLASASGTFDLSNMRLSFSGGAALSREIFDACRDRLGLVLRQAYGLTEAIMVAHNDLEDIDALWHSVGRPAGDARVQIDHSGTATGMGIDLGDGVGELMIRSSSVMPFYLDDEAETAACFRDGWLLTGDLARQDENGNLFIVGRSKLLIEVLGFKIDPIEVEQTLAKHEAVAEALVVGVPSSHGNGQNLKAYVVPVGEEPVPEELIRFLRARLSTQKVPTLFEFRQDFPKSSTGKIMRGKLAAEA